MPSLWTCGEDLGPTGIQMIRCAVKSSTVSPVTLTETGEATVRNKKPTRTPKLATFMNITHFSTCLLNFTVNS